MKKYIQLDKEDNVVVAVTPFEKDDIIELGETKIKILSEVPVGHKIAVKNIRQKESVIKCGLMVGLALVNISAGEHVHIHNVAAE